MNGEHEWIAEGSLEFETGEITQATLERAVGDFALLALRDDGVLLASGRAGGYRPIYVASPSPDLVVASTRLTAVLTLLPGRAPIDLGYLSASILGTMPHPESTPYTSVRRLPPGEAWLIRPGVRPERWNTRRPLVDIQLKDDRELGERLLAAIKAATRRSASGPGRLAVQASGGLDSGLILSLIHSMATSGEIAETPVAIAYEYAAPIGNDDRPYLRSLENYLGIHAERVRAGDAAVSVHQPMVVDAMPARSPILLSARAIGTIAQEHGASVVLTGHGGDPVLDGDLRLFGDIARNGRFARAFKGAMRTRGAVYRSPTDRFVRFLLRPALEPLLPRSAILAVRRVTRKALRWGGPALAGEVYDDYTAPATSRETPAERYAKVLDVWRLTSSSSMRAQEELLGGYAIRTPLLDDDFVRFAATLPPLALLRGGYLRGLMREAMRGLVPEELRLRETKGAWYWFVEQTLEQAGGLGVFTDLADVRMLADLGLVEPKAFKRLFDHNCRNPGDADYEELWSVLSAEAFVRAYAGESPTGTT